MSNLKLRQAAMAVNYKRVERLYWLEGLHIRRRRRKRLIATQLQSLLCPALANEVWSMGFVLDRVATGRTLKCLTAVEDATHEAIAVLVEHSMGGEHLTRVFDGICSLRGKPQVIRTDNGPEFTGKAVMVWAHRQGIRLRLIEPEKPNRNAYVESFNGRLWNECLNEHWFTSLDHAKRVTETWRHEYNEERPKRSLGRLTPAQHAKQLAQRAVTMLENSKALCY